MLLAAFKCSFARNVSVLIIALAALISAISNKDSSCQSVRRQDSEKSSETVHSVSGTSNYGTDVEDWDCKQLDACSDKLGFEAILALHQRLDDDANGNVDIAESDEFLRDELKYDNGYERQKGFHRNDKQITADELWLAWKSSEVHNWTVEETVQWLILNVELPQYAKNFHDKSIDGTALPRMAVNTMHFLSNLGIKDPIHKHKISLKAMDVVLFGPSKNHNYLKDVLLAFSLIIATGGCWFAYFQHKRAQSHLHKTMKDMESLQHAEESLRDLQKELDKAKLEQEIVVTEKKKLERRLQDEITTIKNQDSAGTSDAEQSKIHQLQADLRVVIEDLHNAEKALQEKSWAPSPALQHWLQLTHELELRNYNGKRAAAENQLANAKEGCEKLRKKRSGFLGTFRVAHGNSIDDVDNIISQAKAALSEVTKDLQERLHRWREIEILCGFSIVQNPGLRNLESILGTTMGNVFSKASVSSRINRTGSEGTITDDDSTSSFPPGVSARSMTNIPFGCSQWPGVILSTGEHLIRKIPSTDLKPCASSSAILQRADAVCYDAQQPDTFSIDGIEFGAFDRNIYDNTSLCGDRSAADSSRPVFTVGGSRDALLRSPLSSRLMRRNQDATKLSKELPKQGSSLLENVADIPENESFNPFDSSRQRVKATAMGSATRTSTTSSVSDEDTLTDGNTTNDHERQKDLKRKIILPAVQKAKAS